MMVSSFAGGDERRTRRFQRDDAYPSVGLAQSSGNPHEHPRRSHRRTKGVNWPLDLFKQFATKTLMARDYIDIVQLVGPIGSLFCPQFTCYLHHARGQIRRDLASLARNNDQVRTEGTHGLEFFARKGIR